MPPVPTAAAARDSLHEHAVARGTEIFLRYGPELGWEGLQRLLADPTQVRYPCAVAFDSAGLRPGELSHPEPRGPRPEDGFTMFVHPTLQGNFRDVVGVVLYQLVAVNYGDFASADDAEGFGAAALGLTRDEYYDRLCALADRLGGLPAEAPGSSCGCGGGG